VTFPNGKYTCAVRHSELHFANGLLIAYGCRLLLVPPVGAKIRAWINNCEGPSIGVYASRLVREVRERGENVNYFYVCSNRPPGVLVTRMLLRVCSVRVVCVYLLKKASANRSLTPGLLNINLFNVYILLGTSPISAADVLPITKTLRLEKGVS
jgi:hypothetical protein